MHKSAVPVTIEIESETDVVVARSKGKEIAAAIGFGLVDQTRIATGISELTRNILQYAKSGRLDLRPIANDYREGLEIVAQDQGPGISNMGAILEGRSLSGRGLGLGIPGTRRLMDEFEINSAPGQGTRVRCVKWVP